MLRGFLKDADIKPHLIRYWLTPAYEEDFDEKIEKINEVYKEAPARAKRGERTESIDEMTGVQALERKHPGLPLAPGKVERRKFEYKRHDTALCLSHAILMLQVENYLLVLPIKLVMRRVSWSISKVVLFQSRLLLDGVLLRTISTRIVFGSTALNREKVKVLRKNRKSSLICAKMSF